MNNYNNQPMSTEQILPPGNNASAEIYTAEKVTPPQTPNYSTIDVVFAWVSLIIGYLFCRTLPVLKYPFGGFLFTLIIFITTFVILKIKKVKITSIFLLTGISAIIISATLIVSESTLLNLLSYSYVIVSYCYFIYTAFGNGIEIGFSDFIFIDCIKAVFILPFCSFGKIFSVLSQGKGKNGIKILIKVICGIGIAIVPTCLILFLLSYDKGFLSILNNIFSFDLYDILSHIVSLIFAVPLGMYIFGLFTSSSNKVMQKTITADGCKMVFSEIKLLPQITTLTAVIPILFLYVIYFISQWQYYISGFTGVLPENFSYAEYARDGFFQLCAVSIVNLIVIFVVLLFMKRGTTKSTPVLKILTVVFCTFTLILISTAIAKLVMYIDCYGLTQKRIYAMWLILVIAIVYLVIAIGQFVRHFKTFCTSITVCVVCFAALSLCNVNAIIAEYNVDRYIAGTLDNMDLNTMMKLGDSAIPSLVRLAQEIEKEDSSRYPTELYERLIKILQNKADTLKNTESSIFTLTIPSQKAKTALGKYGMLEE